MAHTSNNVVENVGGDVSAVFLLQFDVGSHNILLNLRFFFDDDHGLFSFLLFRFHCVLRFAGWKGGALELFRVVGGVKGWEGVGHGGIKW